MKIFHIIDSDGIYGAEVMLLNLMQEQRRIGQKPILGSIGDLGEKEKPIENKALRMGLKVKKIRMRRGLNFSGAFKLAKIARDNNVDLFHSHGYKSDILLGLLSQRLRKIAVVRTLHGWTSTKKISKIWIYELLDRFCLRKVDAVVRVNSDSSFKKKGFLKNVNTFVIENGIPKLNFDRDLVIRNDAETANFCKNNFVIGAIGRLSAEKGFNYLIEAMQHLLINGDDYKLVIIGEGNQRDLLETVIRKAGVLGKVLLAGYKKNATDYLPFFDVFILSSLTEGLPITLLEAMQAKKPIVATSVGGIPKALGNGRHGMIVKPRDPKALADAILFLRNNPDKARKMAQTARNIALSNYSSTRMARDYTKVYNRVLAKHKKNIN
ncbi:MAG: glycosyltransferase [Desulfobacteraceae bacterium]|nr:glycosyltransferase [Desulfobacteraceae bacterium]